VTLITTLILTLSLVVAAFQNAALQNGGPTHRYDKKRPRIINLSTDHCII